ncbi:MAG: tyrosine-protein phosphatase [Thermomicrobium sp.]|nr:tyrosine-protein phosphatase [Thermomicrobium sp.]
MRASLLRSVDPAPLASGSLLLCGMPAPPTPLAQFEAESAGAGVHRVVRVADPEREGHESPDAAREVAAGAFPVPVVRLPIADFGVPAHGRRCASPVRPIADWSRAGERVVLHCGAGIGRTGMTVVCVHLVLGFAREEAERRVGATGSSCEREVREEFVPAFASRMNGGGSP